MKTEILAGFSTRPLNPPVIVHSWNFFLHFSFFKGKIILYKNICIYSVVSDRHIIHSFGYPTVSHQMLKIITIPGDLIFFAVETFDSKWNDEK